MNDYHEANRRGWNAAARAGQGQADKSRNWQECYTDPTRLFLETELRFLSDVAGKNVCVLGSGDNLAVFALAGLGATVTSVDISEEQLAIAAGRASELGISVDFVRADVTDLSALDGKTFEIVYTGGHVAVWVSDLRRYYREAVRILKAGGLFVVNEYHPFRRLWKDRRDALELAFGYFDRGPHQWDRADEIEGAAPGSLPSYEFHWTVSEFISAVVKAGTELLVVEEQGNEPEGWEIAPLTGLPQCLILIARKPQS
jgi:SAM-dependent methyltransferase